MPVLNGEKYLNRAIESVLGQSFSDFEFVIINDGSTDKTEEVIKSYHDQRIVYLRNDQNLGLAKSFNIGIRVARGQFIARMDADDISITDRFEKQLYFLEKHKDVDIIGSSVILINKDGRRLKKIKRPTNHIEIKWQSLFSTPLFHPTVMARSEVLKENLFDESYHNSEDYELWSRLLFTTDTRFANISEPLLLYRTFSNSFTQKLDSDKRAVSAENTMKNIERYIQINSHEKNILTLLRQDQVLSFRDLWTILYIYLKAARIFCEKEKIKVSRSLFIYSKLFSLFVFLIKNKVKHFA